MKERGARPATLRSLLLSAEQARSIGIALFVPCPPRCVLVTGTQDPGPSPSRLRKRAVGARRDEACPGANGSFASARHARPAAFETGRSDCCLGTSHMTATFSSCPASGVVRAFGGDKAQARSIRAPRPVISNGQMARATFGIGMVAVWSLLSWLSLSSVSSVAAAAPGEPTPATVPACVEPSGGAAAHTSAVNALAIAPDGKVLASASRDGTVKLWSMADGRLLRTLVGHTDGVNALLFTPSGRTLVSGGDDGAVRVWSMPKGDALGALPGTPCEILDLALVPNQDVVAAACRSGQGGVRLWSLRDRKALATVDGYSSRLPLTFLSGGKLIATANPDHSIKLSSIPDGRVVATLRGHSDEIMALATSPSGEMLASGGRDKTVRLWSVPDGNLVASFSAGSPWTNHLAFNGDGTMLASGSSAALDPPVTLWSIPERKVLRVLSRGPVDELRFTQDGSLAVAGNDNSLKIWSAADGRILSTLKASRSTCPECISHFTFVSDAQRLIFRGRDRTVRVWSTATRQPIGEINGSWRWAVAPDGKTAAVGSRDGSVMLLDLSSPCPPRKILSDREGLASAGSIPEGPLLGLTSETHVVDEVKGLLARWRTPRPDLMRGLILVAELPDSVMKVSIGELSVAFKGKELPFTKAPAVGGSAGAKASDDRYWMFNDFEFVEDGKNTSIRIKNSFDLVTDGDRRTLQILVPAPVGATEVTLTYRNRPQSKKPIRISVPPGAAKETQ